MPETPPSDRRSAPLLVVGLGNDHRRDDRCGLEVVRLLRGRLPPTVRLLEGPRDAARLLDLWEGARHVIVIDAMQGHGPPGSVRRWELTPAGGLESLPATSTHGLGLAEAVEIGRSLGRLPDRLTVFGIEVTELGVGDGLAPEVAHGVGVVVEQVLGEATPCPFAGPPRRGGSDA